MRRAHASKTWKRFEPDDEVVSKDLESLEEKKEVDEDVTEPPKKRRRSRKTGKSRRSRTRMEDDRRDVSYSRSKEDSHQQDDEMESTTATTFKRKILRLNKINRESYRSEDEPNVEYKPRKSRSRSRKTKKVKRVRRTKTPKSTTANASPLRQHCLNIRTFARQFGTIDVDEFAQEHCAFIENYYPHLTCDKRSEYIAECQKYY